MQNRYFLSVMLLALFQTSAFTQNNNVLGKATTVWNLPLVTDYIKVGDGGCLKKKFSFTVKQGVFTIYDFNAKKEEVFGSMIADSNGVDKEGNYFENYKSDSKGDVIKWYLAGNKLRIYQFLYEKKNGTFLAVVEAMEGEFEGFTRTTTYYTEGGNDKFNGGNGISPASAELANLLTKAATLKDISSVIEATYQKQGEKDYTTNREAYSWLYTKNKWWSALLTYDATDNSILRVLFFLDKNSTDYISKNSFKYYFTLVTEDGETKWVNTKTKISYEVMPDDKTGIIRILYVD